MAAAGSNVESTTCAAIFERGRGFSRADKRWDQLGFSPWRARSMEALPGMHNSG